MSDGFLKTRRQKMLPAAADENDPAPLRDLNTLESYGRDTKYQAKLTPNCLYHADSDWYFQAQGPVADGASLLRCLGFQVVEWQAICHAQASLAIIGMEKPAFSRRVLSHIDAYR